MNQTQGTFYVVATPIGNLDDISARAIQILQSVDLILAEDCRHSKKLCQVYQIQTPLKALHTHNESASQAFILEKLMQGKSLALITDAGTPLVSDPGQYTIASMRQAGIDIVPIPGPCALIAALSVSGLKANQFVFEGFLPIKAGQRQKHLQSLVGESRTLVFYEAPHRIVEALSDMLAVFGETREAVVARELTKYHETIIAGTLQDCFTEVSVHANQQLGEFVVVVAGSPPAVFDKTQVEVDIDALLQAFIPHMPVKQLTQILADVLPLSKNTLYQRALAQKVGTHSSTTE